MDIGLDLFVPIVNVFFRILTINVTFFGNVIPLYVFLIFGLLIGLFISILSMIAGLHL